MKGGLFGSVVRIIEMRARERLSRRVLGGEMVCNGVERCVGDGETVKRAEAIFAMRGKGVLGGGGFRGCHCRGERDKRNWRVIETETSGEKDVGANWVRRIGNELEETGVRLLP